MMTQVHTVNSAEEARMTVEKLAGDGYVKDNIYIMSHDDREAEGLAQDTRANTVGIIDEGVFNAIANLFRSKGDELRAKLQSMGVSGPNAERLEEEMDHGRIVVLAWGGNLNFDPTDGDPDILYPPNLII
jgi:hypothetical protein